MPRCTKALLSFLVAAVPIPVACMAIALLLLPAGAARAADAKTCDAYVKEATAKAQGVRQFNCGFDVNDARWSTERSRHATWCKSADKDAIERETAQRRGEIKVCQTCRVYADLAVAAAADNAKLKCGFDGSRWTDKSEDHFNWCLQQQVRNDTEAKGAVAKEKPAQADVARSIDLETSARILAVTHCKSTKPKARKTPQRQSSIWADRHG